MPQTQPPVVQRARQLRKAMNLPEILLWQQLRLRPGGWKFRRQHPLGPYVVDFCCMSHRLAIEVDGIAHDMADQPERDLVRTQFLEDNGFTVIRVSAAQVLADAVGTVEAVVAGGAMPLHRPADGPPPRTGEE